MIWKPNGGIASRSIHPSAALNSRQVLPYQHTRRLVRSLIVADNVLSERADYSNDRFFGELVPSPDDRRGPLCLCAERPYGRGRVILFGDSTIWSNFSFYAVSNERLFASLIQQRGTVVGMFLVVLSYVCTWGTLTFTLKRAAPLYFQLPVREAVYWGISLVAVLFVTARACNSVQYRHALALPGDGLKRMALDMTNSHVELRADVRRGTDTDLHDYSTFYAWLSRSGWSPYCVDGHRYEDSRIPAMIVNPIAPIPHGTTERIRDYLHEGGKLLFLYDTDLVRPDVVKSFLARFDVRIEPVRTAAEYFDANGPDLQSTPLSLPFDILSGNYAARGARRTVGGGVSYSVVGVTPLLVDSSGVVIAGEKRVGKGKITVFSRSILFSEFIFGDVWGGKEPSNEKLEIYRFAHDLVAHACSD